MIEEKWFGKTFGTYGDLTHDFLIKTRGSVKIQSGKLFIELIKNGKINVDVNLLYEVDSLDKINKDGIYYYDGSIYIKIGGGLVEVADGTDSTYVSYVTKQKVSGEKRYLALNNIGLVFKTLLEAQETVIEGFVFILEEQAFYTVNNGVFLKLDFSLPDPYNKQFTIKRTDSTEGGALKLIGEDKKNGISLEEVSIYQIQNRLFLDTVSGGEVIVSIGGKNTLQVTSSLVISYADISTTGYVQSNCFISPTFLPGLVGGFRLYTKDGKAILEVDKVIEREANLVNKEVRTYSDGSTVVLFEAYSVGGVPVNGVYVVKVSPEMDTIKNGDLIEIQPYIPNVEPGGETKYLKVPMLFYVTNASKGTVKLYPNDGVLTLNKVSGKDQSILTYESPDYGTITATLESLINDIFIGAPLYRVALVGDSEDPTTWLETYCTDYIHNSISLQHNYVDGIGGEAHITKHTIIGDIVKEGALDPSLPKRLWDLGFYSDLSVLSGTVFRYPLDLEIPTTELEEQEEEEIDPEVQEELANIIHFPRYSTDLNNSLVTYHKKVEDEDIFENVIPTIKWVKKCALNSPLKEINVAGLDETPEKDNSCIAYKDESWQYIQETTYEEFEELKDRVDTAEQNISNLQTSAVPVGVILMWSSSTAPDGWLLCNGLSFSLTTYPKLYEVLGSDRVPDLRDKFIVGAGHDYALGGTGGEKSHTLTEDEIPSHNHSLNLSGKVLSGSGDWNFYYGDENVYLSTELSSVTTSSVGRGASHNNLPPYYALTFIIKAKEAEVESAEPENME